MNIELYGSEGAIDTYGERLFRRQGSENHAIKAPDAGPLAYPHTSRFHHFVNVIPGREEPCVTLEQALAVQCVIDGIYAAARHNTQALAYPIVRRFSDIHGRRLFLRLGLAIFSAGSILLGFSGSMDQVVAFRAVQGVGGGTIMTCCYVAVADLLRSVRYRGSGDVGPAILPVGRRRAGAGGAGRDACDTILFEPGGGRARQHFLGSTPIPFGFLCLQHLLAKLPSYRSQMPTSAIRYWYLPSQYLSLRKRSIDNRDTLMVVVFDCILPECFRNHTLDRLCLLASVCSRTIFRQLYRRE